MRILVLTGGLSPEREVSFLSGKRVARELLLSGHEVAVIDAAYDADPFTPFKSVSEPRADEVANLHTSPQKAFGEGILAVARRADAVFIALHGKMGENGTIKAIFEAEGIAVTGNSFKSEAVSMDKHLSKLLFKFAGLKTPDWRIVKKGEKPKLSGLSFPLCVKPCSAGSSVGVSFANSLFELKRSLDVCFKIEESAIIEEKIEGREFSVGVLQGGALPPIEIKPKSGFYDYKNKYVSGLTDEICPAKITPKEDAALRKCALSASEALGLEAVSRSDMIMTDSGEIYLIETNANPGMTETSLLPKEAAAAGIDFYTLCKRLLDASANKKILS